MQRLYGNKSFILELGVIIFLCGAVLGFHWRGLQPGYTFLPVDLASSLLPWRTAPVDHLQNWLVSDPLYQFYPFLTYTTEELATGNFPLWTPDIQMGHPVIADPLFQPAYPLFPLLALITGTVARAFSIGLGLHVLLAVLGTYALLRARTHGTVASAAGALTYGLSGYLVTWLETPFWTATLAWLPVILLLQEWAFRTRRWRYHALSALAFTIAILAGQLQFSLFFALVWGLYALGRALELYRETGEWRGKMLVATVIAIVSGGLGASVFLFPFVEFLELSRRSAAGAGGSALPVTQLITVLLPDYFGSPTFSNSYRGIGNYSESTLYAGVVALALACAAPLVRKRFFPTFLFALFLTVLALALWGAAMQLPGLSYLGLSRMVFVVPLLVALLVPYTLEAARRATLPVMLISLGFAIIMVAAEGVASDVSAAEQQMVRDSMTRALLLLAGLAALFLSVRWLPGVGRYSTVWHSMVVLLILADLYLWGAGFNPAGPIDALMPPTSLSETLQRESPYRTALLQREGSVLFGANGLLRYGIADAGGYSSLLMHPYYALIAKGDPVLDVPWMTRTSNMMTFSFPSRRLLDLLQAGRLVSHVPLNDGEQVETVHGNCDASSGEITRTQSVRGEFIASETHINRMDLRVRRIPEINARGSITVRLWQSGSPERQVLSHLWDSASLTDEQALTVYFAPEPITAPQTYRWEMSTEEDGTGIALCTNSSGEAESAIYGIAWRESRIDDYYLYERTVPLPRAYVVYQSETLAGTEAVSDRVLSPDFNPRQRAVIDLLLPLNAASDMSTPALIRRYSATEIDIEANASTGGLLVLGDTYHPGWQAYVDGEAVAVLRVNGIWRGVPLSEGAHLIEFRFEPLSLRTGAVISAIALGMLVISLIYDRSISRKLT